MITVRYLLENKEHVVETANRLTVEDLEFLVCLLSEKVDDIRYQAFLVLQKRSEWYDDVYPFWKTFVEKIDSDNSYQRSIGIMLLAENVKWDKDDLFAATVKKYLSHCMDEKPITSRQTIQSISKWIGFKPQYREPVKTTLLQIDISSFKDTMRKSILLDIIGVLAEIQKIERSDGITEYFAKAMTGGILDRKAIRQIGSLI